MAWRRGLFGGGGDGVIGDPGLAVYPVSGLSGIGILSKQLYMIQFSPAIICNLGLCNITNLPQYRASYDPEDFWKGVSIDPTAPCKMHKIGSVRSSNLPFRMHKISYVRSSLPTLTHGGSIAIPFLEMKMQPA